MRRRGPSACSRRQCDEPARAHYAILPGAGSAGVAWKQLAAELDAVVLPIGDEPDVESMAAAMLTAIDELSRPRVLVGASLGAMVALEVSRRISIDGLVLIAAGFGIKVGDSVLEWVKANPPDLLAKMARIGLAHPEDQQLRSVREQDFAAHGGQPALLHHLNALAAYRRGRFQIRRRRSFCGVSTIGECRWPTTPSSRSGSVECSSRLPTPGMPRSWSGRRTRRGGSGGGCGTEIGAVGSGLRSSPPRRTSVEPA